MNFREEQIAAIYCRLSKEDGDKLKAGDESGSIQNQKLLLMEYAVSKGFTIFRVYVDDDYGGFSDRPQFNQMLEDAQRGLFNIILCKHQSRFTRDMQKVEEYIHGCFVEWGIRFISLTDNVDTAVQGGKKSRQINGLVNEWYCEDLSENVKSVIRAKREKGQYVGAFVSYGYEKDPEEKHRLIIDKEAAEVVREIFRLYLSGLGVQAIAQELTLRGIPTPSQYKKAQGSRFSSPNSGFYSTVYGAWSVNTVRRILRNETYIGSMVQGRERSISYKTKKLVSVPREQWAVVPDCHEAIISKEDFYAVQRLIDSRRTVYGAYAEDREEKAGLFSGKLRCKDCGGTLHRGGQSKDGKTVYYRCQLAQKTKGRDCTPHNINGRELEELLEDKIKVLINGTVCSSFNTIVSGVLMLIDGKEEQTAVIQRQLKEVENSLLQVQNSISLMYADRLRGLLTETEFVSFKDHFIQTQETLNRQRAEYLNILDKGKAVNPRTKLEAYIKDWETIPVMTHEVLNSFIEYIEVGEKVRPDNAQEILIHWNF